MIRSYKFSLYPTEQQVKVMDDTIETCRHLYNDSLGERRKDILIVVPAFWSEKCCC